MNHTQKGVALIELALVIPFLLLLSMIAADFGRAMYQYDILTKAVRDGARYLTTQIPSDPAAITKARNLVVYGNLTGSPATPLALGLTTANVPDPTWATTSTTPPINAVTIKISDYKFHPMFTSVFGITFAPTAGVPFPEIKATMRSFM